MNYLKGPFLTCHKSVLVLLILTIAFEFLEYGNSITEVIKGKSEDKLRNKLANFKTHNVSISSPAHANDTTNVTPFPVVTNDGKLPEIMKYFGLVEYYLNVKII